MTVEELIDQLMQVEDKQKDVMLSIKLGEEDDSHEKEIADVIEQQLGVIIYNW